jgi:polyferredoxin
MESHIAKKMDLPGPLRETEEVKKDAPLRKPKQEKGKPYAWGLRNSIQLIVFLVTIGIGVQFFIYVLQASGNGPITVSRPPGVEGFLPIGAFMGWKLFTLSGIWDPVHPAAMVILGFAGLISLTLRKSFCGWFCPVGTRKNYRIPVWIDIPLRSLKYLLLGFFIWTIFKMSVPAIFFFLQGAYYKVSDVKMLFFFTQMSTFSAVVLVILVLSSLIIRNAWCRYLCPYGALMGLLALISPTRIQRNPDTCIDCKLCSRVCPYHLPVDRKLHMRSAECNGCMDCTSVCPVKNTLELRTKGFGKKVWSIAKLGAVVIVVFVLLVYTARVTGHWTSNVSEKEFRMRLQEIHSPKYTHPGIRKR